MRHQAAIGSATQKSSIHKIVKPNREVQREIQRMALEIFGPEASAEDVAMAMRFGKKFQDWIATNPGKRFSGDIEPCHAHLILGRDDLVCNYLGIFDVPDDYVPECWQQRFVEKCGHLSGSIGREGRRNHRVQLKPGMQIGSEMVSAKHPAVFLENVLSTLSFQSPVYDYVFPGIPGFALMVECQPDQIVPYLKSGNSIFILDANLDQRPVSRCEHVLHRAYWGDAGIEISSDGGFGWKSPPILTHIDAAKK